jgi:hypothetical protein
MLTSKLLKTCYKGLSIYILLNIFWGILHYTFDTTRFSNDGMLSPSGASLFVNIIVAHLAQVCFGASVPNTIIKPERKLCGITCVSSNLPVCNRG